MRRQNHTTIPPYHRQTTSIRQTQNRNGANIIMTGGQDNKDGSGGSNGGNNGGSGSSGGGNGGGNGGGRPPKPKPSPKPNPNPWPRDPGKKK